MSDELHRIKKALLEAGVEIYRAADDEIQVAERVRLHIMDSGVRVHVAGPTRVCFTVRSQRSDFPDDAADHLLERVRVVVGPAAGSRGYTESLAETREVTDPSEPSRVLDVWHEVTYEKAAPDLELLVDEVRWALQIDKCVKI